MDPYERSKLGDAVKEMKFKRNEYIIVEGDEGSSFYLIVEGTAIATKNFGGPEPQKVKDYKKGGNYYKSLKREFSMLLKTRNNEPRLIELSKFFNSHFGKLYVVYSNLEAIKLLKDNYDDKRAKKMIELNLKKLRVKEDKIDVVCRELKKLFNNEAKLYLKS